LLYKLQTDRQTTVWTDHLWNSLEKIQPRMCQRNRLLPSVYSTKSFWSWGINNRI